MNETNDKKQICQVVKQKPGRFAMVELPSGEQIMISIGSATVKILAKRDFWGWCLPKVIASERLSTWQSKYQRYNGFYRRICRTMILDGLLTLLSTCESI